MAGDTIYEVLTIARYIINYCNEKGYEITNLKLQKLLYFVQAVFLSLLNKPCFKEKIEAWKFGPVVREAYYEFKEYGNREIPPITEYAGTEYYFAGKMTPFDSSAICESDKELINKVIDTFGKYSASTLVKITHANGPWKEVYAENQNNVIDSEKLKEVFVNE